MKRFGLFGGDTYYALGGFNDFIGSYDFLENAVAEGHRRQSLDYGKDSISWWHVIDIVTMKIMAGTPEQAHGAGNLEL
jgi:hypothetical protein